MVQEGDRSSVGLAKSTGIVSLMTLFSRVLGLVRDIVIARFFGADGGTDAFFVAFKIPNFLRRLFAEGAFAQAFVPVLSEYKTRGPHAAVQELVDRVAGTLGLALVLVSAVAVMAAPVLIMLFAPGFVGDDVKMALASEMLRLTFPYLFLISMTAFAGSILNSYGRFAAPAFTPVLLNLSLIGSVLWISPLMADDKTVTALAYGVLIAGVVQLLFQLPFLSQVKLLPKPKWGRDHPGVKQILTLMLPALLGVSVSQINLLLDTVLASFLAAGSVSWLYYSDRLTELPLGIIGIAIATVILPGLSRKHAERSSEEFSKTLDWALRTTIVIGLPASLALFVLAEPLLITLFQRGAFSENDVTMAAMSLRAYSIGLLAFMLIKILAPGFYARKDTKTPVKIAIKAMAANMVMNLILVWPLAHAGLALATSLAAFLNAGLLYLGLRQAGVYQPMRGWGLLVMRYLFAVVMMTFVLLMLKGSTEEWLLMDWFERSWQLLLLCMVGAASYFFILFSLGLRPRHFLHR